MSTNGQPSQEEGVEDNVFEDMSGDEMILKAGGHDFELRVLGVYVWRGYVEISRWPRICSIQKEVADKQVGMADTRDNNTFSTRINSEFANRPVLHIVLVDLWSTDWLANSESILVLNVLLPRVLSGHDLIDPK